MSFKDHETFEPSHQPCESGLFRSFTPETMNPGRRIGFADEANYGLMLCTEYLGFESYDMRMSDDEVENKMTCQAEDETEMVERKRRKTTENVVALKQKREFPPPLSSLNSRGIRSFYLRPVRKAGRLELRQVMVDRSEIFHASREDGRLRLHLLDSFCDLEDPVDLGDEEESIITSDLECCRGFKEDNTNGKSDQVVNLSMINHEDNDAVTSLRCKSCHEILLNSDDDVTYFHDQHDGREWRYKNCYKIVGSRNHDENIHHYHIHPYSHHSNDNMHLWSRTYVKTR